MRGLRNQNNRVDPEDRVILAYGRNIEAGKAIIKDLLKLCRKEKEQRKALKRREDVTAEEEAKLQEEFFNQFLPAGWYFDGSSYCTRDGFSQIKHPNLETIIQRHLDEVNDEIGEFNRELRNLLGCSASAE